VKGRVQHRGVEFGSDNEESQEHAEVTVSLLCNEIIPAKSLEGGSKSVVRESKRAAGVGGTAERAAKMGALRITVHLEEASGEKLKELRELLSSHRGDVPVELVLEDGQSRRVVRLSEEFKVKVNDELLRSLRAMFGDGMVSVK
ncbi:MAG: hypothetical protein GDYSWBUE_002035, partial [Candidatus Fervidibacterota bacterium]